MTDRPEPSGSVFISYASQDEEAARRICEALRAAGLQVWLDKSELRGGDAWDAQIKKRIHDCTLFIPVVSAHSNARSEGYFRGEWNLATRRLLNMAQDAAFLVPVVVDGTREDDARVPDEFLLAQWTRLPGGETPPAFVERVRQLLQGEPASARHPRLEETGRGGTSRAHGRSDVRRWSVGLAIAALLLLGAGAYWYFDRAGETPAGISKSGVVPAAADEKSIAVLPFVNMSTEAEQEYFSDGISEQLINSLAKLPGLRVISRSSTFSLKGQNVGAREIAERLGVTHVLEGSVRKAGNLVRVDARLIDARSDAQVWSETFDRELTGIFAMQDEITLAVVRELKVALLDDGLPARSPPESIEAYNAYLRGRFYWNEGDPTDLEKARQNFERALEFDPGYALAHAAMADYYSALPFYSTSRPDEVFPKAKAEVARALELDARLPEAHAALAYIRAYYDWDWRDAGKEFELALASDANNANLQHRYSRYLSSVGRTDEALVHMQRARELDPLSLIIQANVGVIHYFGRQFDASLGQLQKLAAAEPEFPVAHWGMGLAREQMGDMEGALASFQRAAELTERGTNVLASMGHALAMSGKPAEARAILGELAARAKKRYVPSYQLALVHAGLGDEERAFESLEKAFDERSTLLTYLKMDPRFDSLRADPRFKAMLRRLNFLEEPVT
ncbi:MAG TPA: TIR domain-containing protein [Steroidobacteraceae bacterium]|jgi:TolB-like protein/Tfp pilus assembly protein PilF|nr:TIR domain-containing protein [Steroidobacteraceae bacterium]